MNDLSILHMWYLWNFHADFCRQILKLKYDSISNPMSSIFMSYKSETNKLMKTF